MGIFDITSRWSGYIREWHLCYYEPNHKEDDFLTQKVLSFKNGINSDIEVWSKWSFDELKNLNIKFDFIVRSLGSNELVANGSAPLDKLCRSLANGLNSEFIPELICKNKVTEKLSTIPKLEDRKAQLDGVFYAKDNYNRIQNKSILIVDDVATSGTTSRFILQAIKSKYPTIKPYLFTIAKTSREDGANANIGTSRFNNPNPPNISNLVDDLPF